MIGRKSLEEQTHNTMVEVGEKILRLIELQGLTQREFCRSIGMSESDLSNFRYGRKSLGIRSLTRIAIGLGLKLQINFGDTSHKEKEQTPSLPVGSLEELLLLLGPKQRTQWSS